MIFIFLLYIKLSILHKTVSLGYSCSGPSNNLNEIVLLQTNNIIHKQLNTIFLTNCQNFYQIYILNVLDNGVIETLKLIKEYPNVINLYVSDYYHFFDSDEPHENLIYAGDINDINEPKICVATNKTKSKFDCGEKVKVISKSVEEINSGDLYNFVSQIQNSSGNIYTRDSCSTVLQNPSDLKTVLLCSDYDIHENNINIDPLKLQITKYCDSTTKMFNNNFLAVLAPEPFQVNTEYSVPVIFYETSYILPKFETYFPNSMTPVSWPLLKYGFLEFIKRVGWQRVVIVSDDSLYSIEFENELIKLFNKELITYTVIRCEDDVCNMNTALTSLCLDKAKIVIANAEEKNVKYLIENSGERITWLVRDLPVTSHQFIGRQHVFSFTLGPAVRNSEACNLNDKILGGINSIVKAYRCLNNTDYTMGKQKFYRKFAQLMRRIKRPESMVFVHKITKSNSAQEILSMHVDDAGAVVVVDDINFTDPFINNPKPVDGPPCLARSNNYFKPCEDILVLVFMFVVILFVTTLSLITCYFHKSSPFHDIRYQYFR